MPAGEEFDAGAGPGPLLVDLRRAVCFCGKSRWPEKELPWYGLAPVPSTTMSWPQRSKTWPCGLAKPIGDVDVELLGARLVAEDAGVGAALGRAVGRFDLRVMERPFLEVEGAAGIEHEAVGRCDACRPSRAR